MPNKTQCRAIDAIPSFNHHKEVSARHVPGPQATYGRTQGGLGACLALLLLLLMLLEVTEAEKDPKLRTPKSRLVQGPDRRAASDGAAVT
jgi:hypothetical protein